MLLIFGKCNSGKKMRTQLNFKSVTKINKQNFFSIIKRKSITLLDVKFCKMFFKPFRSLKHFVDCYVTVIFSDIHFKQCNENSIKLNYIIQYLAKVMTWTMDSASKNAAVINQTELKTINLYEPNTQIIKKIIQK